MPTYVRPVELVAILLSLSTGLSACATAPEMIPRQEVDAHGATQLAKEREQVVAALRADMAATRIAAAKQEAELQELRATVAYLRQETRDFQQTLLEARRTLEARDTEIATVKAAHDALAQMSSPGEQPESAGAALQQQVATLSQELQQVKQSLAVLTAQATVASASLDQFVVRGPANGMSVPSHESVPRDVVSAMYVVPSVSDRPTAPRVTVRPGDTLARIARRYQTTVDALRRVNGLPSHRVTVGQELQLP